MGMGQGKGEMLWDGQGTDDGADTCWWSLTRQDSVLLQRLLPADLQGRIQDVTEAEVSHGARHCPKTPRLSTHMQEPSAPTEPPRGASGEGAPPWTGLPGARQRDGAGGWAGSIPWESEPPRTVLVGAHQLGGAARAVPGRGEAQHRGEVLGELAQPRHVAHVDAVLEVGPHRDHRGLVLVLRLPGDELRERGAAMGIPSAAASPHPCHKHHLRPPFINSVLINDQLALRGALGACASAVYGAVINSIDNGAGSPLARIQEGWLGI